MINQNIEAYLLLYLGFLIFFFFAVVIVNQWWPDLFEGKDDDKDPPVYPMM